MQKSVVACKSRDLAVSCLLLCTGSYITFSSGLTLEILHCSHALRPFVWQWYKLKAHFDVNLFCGMIGMRGWWSVVKLYLKDTFTKKMYFF